MDRPTRTTAVSFSTRDDSEPAGWDAHTVWQERVRDPHLGIDRSGGTARIVLEAGSAGWDPLETWKARVLRPRKLRR